MQDEEGGAAPEAVSTGDQQAGATVAPTFTPYTVHPTIKNFDEVMRALEREYPPLLRDAGIGGTVQVWYFLDEESVIQRVQINESSGHQALDNAALQVSNVIQFTPALNRDQPRPVWLSLPIEFTTTGTASTEAPKADGVRARLRGQERVAGAEAVSSEGETGHLGEVTGTVTDALTGQPLASVQVYVMGTGRGTLTNVEGTFAIPQVPTGAREVVAELIGYEVVKFQVSVPRNARAEVDFDLRISAIGLEKLVVKGTPGRGGS
jgi:TonB family protein